MSDEYHGQLAFGVLVGNEDRETSIEAAEAVLPHLGKIQRAVVKAFRRHGPMTARQAERLPEFDCYGYSTIRKRICELSATGVLVDTGDVQYHGKSPSIIWRLK